MRRRGEGEEGEREKDISELMSPQPSFLLGFALLSKAKGKVKATSSHLQTKLQAKSFPQGQRLV